MRNALAHVGKAQQPMVASHIRTSFTQETEAAAGAALTKAHRANGA
jgi:transposase-like protein